MRIESRLDGMLAVRFRERYLAVSLCAQAERAQAPASEPPVGEPKKKSTRKSARPTVPAAWRESQSRLLQGNSMPLWAAAAADRTRTRDKLD